MPSRVSPPGFKALEETSMFKPTSISRLQLEHKVGLAPLTRTRAPKKQMVFFPGDLDVEYYSQRASKGGFMLTEACPISRLAAGYPGVLGVFTQKQIEGCKRVTDAVHAKGAFIYCQLWHVGRVTMPSSLGGKNSLNSGDIPIAGNGRDGSPYAQTPPKPMKVEQIKQLTEDYAAASKRALEAGFDGVEIHGANGYLLDKFLHENVNVRSDEYGTNIEGRCRFHLEVIKAVITATGADRVGIELDYE